MAPWHDQAATKVRAGKSANGRGGFVEHYQREKTDDSTFFLKPDQARLSVVGYTPMETTVRYVLQPVRLAPHPL